MDTGCPFPGMDPFIEADWGDFHARFITYAADAIQEQLPSGLRAKMQKRVIVSFPDDDPPRTRDIYPDVHVAPSRRDRGGGTAVLDAPATAEPVLVTLDDEPVEQTYIEIAEAATGRPVVTVVELLSPANKVPGDGMRQYRRKQSECRSAGVNLVELDLLRAGRDVLLAPRAALPAARRTPYAACVFRPARWPTLEVYPIPLRSPLPSIRIPLRDGTDADVRLDLQALFDLAYVNGAYADTDYAPPPPGPPLAPDDAAWVADRLSMAGR